MGWHAVGVTLKIFLACGLTIAGRRHRGPRDRHPAIYRGIRQAIRWAFSIDLFPLDVYNLDRVPC
jgi:hypothetical protein